MNLNLIKRIVPACLAVLAGATLSHAQTGGVWTNNSSGLWSGTTNWQSGLVADGAGATADFSQVAITTNRSVTLDGNHNLGNLIFGNSGNFYNWYLLGGGGALNLTNPAGSPGFTVTNIATVTAPVTGSQGLTKNGPGTLALGGQDNYGGTTTVGAGTLQLTNSLSTAPVLYLSFDNVSGKTVVNQGTGGTAMNGTLTGTATISTNGGRYGNALSIPAGAANAAYVLVSSPVVALTNSKPWTVAMWVKTTTAGGVYAYQGAGGWASGNVVFYLNQGNGNGFGTKAGGVGWGQGWQTGTTAINDGNWHFVVMTCNGSTKAMYVDGNTDAITSSWAANTGVGTQMWIGGGADTGDKTAGLNGLVDEVYVYNYALSQAQIQTLMVTTNSATLPPLPASTTVAVAAGAKLDLNGNSAAITGLTGNGTVDNTVSGTATLAVNNASNVEFDGLITNSTGTLALNLSGPGTFTLGGTNNAGGAISVGGGELALTGSATINGQANTAARLLVGTASGANASVYQSGANSSVTIAAGGGGSFQLGSAAGAHGYYNHSAGSITVGNASEFDPAGSGGGAGTFGEYDQSGGTLTVGTSGSGATYFLPGRGAAGESSVVNISGGSVTINPLMGDAQYGGYEVNWGAGNQTNATTVSGNGTFTSLNCGVKFNWSNNPTNWATLNLNGGLFQVAGFSAAQNNSVVVNFNGGTLAAGNATTSTANYRANDAAFLGNVASVYVYGGGATFNPNGQAVTITQPFSAPTGNGITAIPVATAGAGYVQPPLVIIQDTTGTGATACAQINPVSGTVTNIVVTAPGNNYTAPTVTLAAGGYTTAATTGTPVLAANVSGGLTLTGSGSLTLAGGATYTGNTVINGGTLIFSSSSFTPATAGNLVVSNGTFSPNVAGGPAFPAANLTLQNNGALTLAYGALTGNPTTAAITLSGNLATPGANLVINITGSGFVNGQFPLISYAGTGPASISNIKLGALPGIAASLVNNPAGKSLDLLIVPTQTLTWYGEQNANWDFTSSNWNSGSSTLGYFKNYTNDLTQALYGDVVTFDDTLYNNGISAPNTNVVLGVTVYPNAVTENSAGTYAITGAGGISGAGTLTMSGSGTFTLGTTNSYTGGTVVNAGTLIISNNAALGAGAGLLTLNSGELQVGGNTYSGRPVTLTANSILDVVPGVTAQWNGAISGSGLLTLQDSGSLTLSGPSTATGGLLVNGGNLTLAATSNNYPAAVTVSDGALNVTGTANVAGLVTVGNGAGNNAVLNIAGGTLFANLNPGQLYNSSLAVGTVAGAAGDLQLSSGGLVVNQQIAVGPTTYGAYSQSGGTATIGGFIAIGGSANGGVFNQSGGVLNMIGSSATIGYSTAASYAAMNLSGTAVFNANPNGGAYGGGVWPGEVGTGVLNVAGNAALNLPKDVLYLGKAGGKGTANLLGGTVTANGVSKGSGSGTLNFNGGALAANANSTTFINGLNAAYIYSGGATINDGGFTLTIPQALQAPTGYGVTSIPLASGGSGYLDTPVVVISGGSGSGATAVATVAGGVVTGITVTSPGTGYASDDTGNLSINLLGGNGSGAAASTPVLTQNVAGSLTKLGAGSVTLSGANTYGETIVSNGVLTVTSAAQTTGAVTVEDGATFGLQITTNSSMTLPGLTLGATATGSNYLNFAYAIGNGTLPAINVGTLTLNGTTTVELAGRFTVGAVPLIHYGALAGSGTFALNVQAPQGVVALVSNSVAQATVYAVIVTTGPGLVWTGTNRTAPNLWDIGVTTNWVLGSASTVYQQTVIPGDFVNFTDSGSGTVVLNTNVSPLGILVSNNATSYSIYGAGSIRGLATLTKLGTGTVTLGLTGDNFAGTTTISNGTVALGAVNAIGAGNLVLGASGTLELAGNSQAVASLSGAGLIDNAGSVDATLTTGSGGTGFWSGTITNLGIGNVIWINNATNTLTVSGSNYLNSVTPSTVQNGTVILTNGGLLNLNSSEFWIAGNAAVTGQVVVAGGTLKVKNNWLVIGRNLTNANGTLIVNSGTVQKTGANNIVVGSLQATGTLIVNGGQVLNDADLWLGEGPGAVAALYLNGGLVQATAVRPNNNGGLPVAGSFAYFNGGVLQADRSTNDFIALPAPGGAMVMSNGLVLDDGGFTIGIQLPLQAGDNFNGGLVKQGAGKVYLDGYNSYTGVTVVTNGTLAGSGTIAGPLVVGAAGNLGAGDAAGIGTFTVQAAPVSLQGNATFRISKDGGNLANDVIAGVSTVNFGGTLTITNTTTDGTALASGDSFPLFTAGGPGNFTTIIGSPGTGLAYNFNPANGTLNVVTGVTIASNPTNITATVSGTTLNLAWPADHLGWILQVQTNGLSTGLGSNWVDVAGSAAATSASVPVNPANPAVFYRLRHP